MNLRQLKWLAILAPFVLIGVLEYSRLALGEAADTWPGRLALYGVFLGGAVFFYAAVFSLVDDLLSRLRRQNRELAALREAGLDIAGELSLDTVLHKVVDQARNLLGTRYGALSVVDAQGAIESFITSGISPEEVQRIGPPPVGRGLLGVVLREGQRLRLEDLGSDARSIGFPPDHPVMRSLLAVPIVCRGPYRGNLYLSEKKDGTRFTAEDEEILARFASQAAIAVDNAHLHGQAASLAVAEERLRISREMHDGQAQVLAYVNTQAQVVQQLVRADRTKEAEEQLERLSSAARGVLADVREGILGLRAVVGNERSLGEALRDHLQHWQDQCGIQARLCLDAEPDLPPQVELQLLRVIQEALSNVRKHSRARGVEVGLDSHGDTLRCTIVDDGMGFDTTAPGRTSVPRFGLATMRERCDAIGARLHITSETGKGTWVQVDYPAPGSTQGDTKEEVQP